MVACYVRNEGLGFAIPYDYEGLSHVYEPDYLVRLVPTPDRPRRTLILEIKGYETDEERAKHTAARRWVSAVNHWGGEGGWAFHVCKDPQVLGHELRAMFSSESALVGMPAAE